MENGETAEQGAARETLEEARARVEVTSLYGVFSIPHISQVYILFRARLLDLDFGPGPESLEVALFEPPSLPWDELAFPVVRRTLEQYCADLDRGGFGVHTGKIEPMRPRP
jgi:ADP-ribose pyrophosphatase YjhB (NUDIX family)